MSSVILHFFIKEGLACLGDQYDSETHSWFNVPNVPIQGLPTVHDINLHHSLRVGQCWRPVVDRPEVYEILAIHSEHEIHTCVWNLTPNGASIELTSYHRGPITYHELFGNATTTAERIYTHGDRKIRRGQVTRRTIWRRHIQDHPAVLDGIPCPFIDNILQTIHHTFHSQPIKIYTDGSWKALGSGKDRALLLDTTSVGGCSLVILSDSIDWRHHPVLVYPITDDGSSPTEHAYTWELMALSIAALIQSRYPAGCQLFSDCKSAIHTVTHTTPTSALLDQHAVLLYPVSKLANRPVASHIAAHPEVHIGNSRPWTQDECGIHLADVAASHPETLNRFTTVNIVTSPLTSSRVLQDLLRVGTWTWCYASKTPVLIPIQTVWQQHSFLSYIQHRDNTRAQARPPHIPTWLSRSWRLTAKVHQFSSASTATRARLQRILLHWSGIGANLRRDDPDSPEALCSECEVLESEYHLLSQCTDPEFRQLRLAATHDAALYIQRQASQHPVVQFMLALHAAIDSHPHGYLMYFGFITSNLAETLPALPDNDPQLLTKVQKTVIGYLRILSKGGLDIIDLARARRHTRTAASAAPSSRAAAQARPARASANAHVPRFSQPASKAQSKRLKRLAHEAGCIDQHTRCIERNALITDYFSKRPRLSLPSSFSSSSSSSSSSLHDYEATHPP